MSCMFMKKNGKMCETTHLKDEPYPRCQAERKMERSRQADLDKKAPTKAKIDTEEAARQQAIKDKAEQTKKQKQEKYDAAKAAKFAKEHAYKVQQEKIRQDKKWADEKKKKK